VSLKTYYPLQYQIAYKTYKIRGWDNIKLTMNAVA